MVGQSGFDFDFITVFEVTTCFITALMSFLISLCSQRNEVAVRKSQKADREKLRRNRLNEHFVELGKALGDTNFFSSI